MSESSSTDSSSQDIVARAGRYYRNARYVIVAMAFGAGLWFGYDGFYNWPKQRAEFDALPPEKQAAQHVPQNETSIMANKAIAIGLLPLAPLLLGFFLYRSRGEYRLSGTTLYVPGNPPVPFEAITRLDLSKWKRKGIARLEYEVNGSSEPRTLTLDDFVYEQVPTDKIVDTIDAWLNPSDEEVETAEEV